MKNYVITALLVLVLLAADSFARDKRVAQVPNGNAFNCETCHTGFGGPRNDFGKAIGNGFLDGNGDVLWGPALAALDSDQDGVSNGEELQDPTGTWAIGQANPGDVNLLSNPGDANSTVGVEITALGVPKSFQLKQNYPNPFNPSTTIEFAVPTSSDITLTIYNSMGQPVRELANESMQPGHYSLLWDGQSDTAETMGSGLYLARLQGDGFERTIRMLLMK
jgi:hypothetical protein